MFGLLMEQVRQVQPTVVVLGYGMASSLEEAAATEMERRSAPVPGRRAHGGPALMVFRGGERAENLMCGLTQNAAPRSASSSDELLNRTASSEILTNMNRFIFLLAVLCPALAFAAAPQKPFELRDGDRVVFLGDALMEREKDYGYIELMMTLRFPDRNVTFRNLGWSTDTPVGISRVSFDWPKGEGEMFRVLMEQVRQVQPTVMVLGYGMASSLEDAAATEMERQADAQSNALRSGARSIAPREGKPTRLDKFVTDYNKLIDAILS
jgi:hypothetical protein